MRKYLFTICRADHSSVNLLALMILLIIAVTPVCAQEDTRIPLRPPIVGPKLRVRLPAKIKLEYPEMVTVKSGAFIMGSKSSDEDSRLEHNVEVSGFEMSKRPITNQQFQSFVQTTGYLTEAERNPTPFEKRNRVNWKKFSLGRANYPVIWITFNDAYAYCRWLSLVSKSRGENNKLIIIDEDQDSKQASAVSFEPYRLPTEAEWEFAARGNNKQAAYPWGEEIDKDKLNYNWNSRVDNIESVKRFLKPAGYQNANDFGLQDMSGNINQWCFDLYAADFYAKSPKRNPYGPKEGEERIARGGSWLDKAEKCRVDARQHYQASERNTRTGFRVVRALPAEIKIEDVPSK